MSQINQISQPPKRIGVNFPDLPEYLLTRLDKLSELMAKLTTSVTNSPFLASSQKLQIDGMGGIGKSTLGTMLGYTDYQPLSMSIDPKAKFVFWEAFSDGIIWIKLGDKAVDLSLVTAQSNLIEILKQQEHFSLYTQTFSAENSINNNKALLRKLFENKKCLLILDDVWHLEQIDAFDILNNKSKLLITTRISGIFLGSIDKYPLGELNNKESLELLAHWAEVDFSALDKDAKEITHKWCENLPFGIKLCGGLFKYRKNFGFTWSDLLKALTDCNLTALSHRELKIDSFIKVSLNMLEIQDKQLAELYHQLIVFPPDKQIPFETIVTFWQHSYPELQNYLIKGWISELANRGLLKIVNIQSQTIELHNFSYVYLAGSLSKEQRQQLHKKLLISYRKDSSQPWHSVKNDGYYYENIAYHLYEAGYVDELQHLLLNYCWLEKKLLTTNIYSLLSDFSFLDSINSDISLLKHKLEASSHILAQDPNQLSSQLLGRLEASSPVLSNLLTKAAQKKEYSWLKPLSPSFIPSPYLYGSLIDHRSSFKSLIVYQWQDKFFAISISSSILDSEELKVWDLETKTKIHTLKEHSSAIQAVAIYQDEDKLFAISAGVGEIIIWNLCNYSIVGILIDHFYTLVQSVKVYKEQNKIFALFVLLNGNFEIWDLSNNFEHYLFQGHSFGVRNLALYQDNNDLVAVSASYDEIRFWDLSNKKEITLIKGYFGSRHPIEIYKDQNKFFAIYADYKTLKIYNLTDKIEIASFLGHSDFIMSLAVYQNNNNWFAISASKDNTLKIWDLMTYKEVAILNGHSSSVEYVTIYQKQNKFFAISASTDHSIKTWDLTAIQNTPNSINRSYPPLSILLYQKQNKFFAISTSVDGYTIWDLETQQKITTFRPKPTLLSSVMHQQNDNTFIISGSFDKTISVCDIGNKTEVITINTTHSGNIYSLASYQDRGKLFVISTSEDSALKIWDIFSETPEIEIATLKGHDDSVYSVAVYEESNKFFAISVSKDHTLKMWDLETYKIIKSFEISNICTVITIYQENNEVLAICGLYGKVKILNLTNKVETTTLETNSSLIKSLAVYRQKDNIFIVVGSVDHTIRVWDLKNRKEVTKITLDHGILSVVVTKDGLIIAGDDYGQTHFLEINIEDPITSISKPKKITTTSNSLLTTTQSKMPNASTNEEITTNLKKGSKLMKRRDITPKDLIQHMEIPDQAGHTYGKNNVYVLGCFEKRVTVFSQQVRALNLIYSLIKEEKIQKGSEVAIIGAGAAGLTATIGAAYRGINVTLFEYQGGVLDIFNNNPVRWLHPHIYDWPEDYSEVSDAGLPLMNWKAGTVRNVVDFLREQWENYRNEWKTITDRGNIYLENVSLKQVSGKTQPDIKVDLGDSPKVIWNNPGFKQKKFQAVILAIGFGIEESKNNLPVISYWSNDTFENISIGQTKNFLISGCGDGGLTDLLRIRIKDFRHEKILTLLPNLENDTGKKLKTKLLEIEKEAWQKYDNADWLYEQYTSLLLETDLKPLFDQTFNNLKAKLRSDTKATLNGEYGSPLSVKASILNRFLAFCLLQIDTSYTPGKLEKLEKESSNLYRVTFKDGHFEHFDEVIIRFGPTPAINSFSNISSLCQPLINRNDLDKTRWPIWEDNFFGNQNSQNP